MSVSPLRILFLGENWYGSCARACCYALRGLGHQVEDVDSQLYSPPWRDRNARAAHRLVRGRLIEEYNRQIARQAAIFRPDFLLAFKGAFVEADTIRTLRERGVACYNYFPDTSFRTHGPRLLESIPEYDCIFYTKITHDEDLELLGACDSLFVRHGYDPALHRPPPLRPEDHERFACDVIVIGTHTEHKESVLRDLCYYYPDLDLAIWGNQWYESCRSEELRGCVRGRALEGELYPIAIASGRINLAIMSGPVSTVSWGDETSTRTFEIPACGGFMVHERSREVEELYAEDEEAVFFDSLGDLIPKIDHYLGHPEERAAIAAAGHARCVPAYSYANRMREIVRHHMAGAPATVGESLRPGLAAAPDRGTGT